MPVRGAPVRAQGWPRKPRMATRCRGDLDPEQRPGRGEREHAMTSRRRRVSLTSAAGVTARVPPCPGDLERTGPLEGTPHIGTPWTPVVHLTPGEPP
ncbi:hypothetical protein MTO96_005178 [Rhipicephalus appendiculatus]